MNTFYDMDFSGFEACDVNYAPGPQGQDPNTFRPLQMGQDTIFDPTYTPAPFQDAFLATQLNELALQNAAQPSQTDYHQLPWSSDAATYQRMGNEGYSSTSQGMSMMGYAPDALAGYGVLNGLAPGAGQRWGNYQPQNGNCWASTSSANSSMDSISSSEFGFDHCHQQFPFTNTGMYAGYTTGLGAYDQFGSTSHSHQPIHNFPNVPTSTSQPSTFTFEFPAQQYTIPDAFTGDKSYFEELVDSIIPPISSSKASGRAPKTPRAKGSKKAPSASSGVSKRRRTKRTYVKDEDGASANVHISVACNYGGCQRTFSHPRDFILHLKEAPEALDPGHGFANHNGKEMLTCPWDNCEKIYARGSMERHYTIHTVQRRCTICGHKTFSDRTDSMRNHHKNLHPRHKGSRDGILEWQLWVRLLYG
ncbi:hypothetical protein CVT26_013002, partial [Gymnopilus dilepis]